MEALKLTESLSNLFLRLASTKQWSKSFLLKETMHGHEVRTHAWQATLQLQVWHASHLAMLLLLNFNLQLKFQTNHF